MTAKNKTDEQPPVLIEQWLPVDVLSAECMRERGASSALPPLYFLHVWWARRPLLVSRAAILAGLLPAWREDWPKELRKKFPEEQSYRQWFVRICGILGDPVTGRKLLARAAEQGRKIPNPYNSARAFTVSPSSEDLMGLGDVLEHTWGTRDVSVLDPFSGGGSIPFESLRYCFRTFANELNPVASVILKATIQYPFQYGHDLAADTRRYGEKIVKKVQERLRPFYTDINDEDSEAVGAAYLWVRTVKCPYTGKAIPLSPTWWLRMGSRPVAIRPIFASGATSATFEIVEGKGACERAHPDEGTVRRGNAISPWAQNQPVDGDYIKAEAQQGRMGHQLCCVALKKSGGFVFRAPTASDEAAVQQAESELKAKLPTWVSKGLVPTEPRRAGRADWAAETYGLTTWTKTFCPRQLLALCTYTEALVDSIPILRREVPDRADAIAALLALSLDKAVDYNSTQGVWDVTRQKVAHAFARHDFSFKWSYAEFDAARNLFPWVLGQVLDAYEGIAKLAGADRGLFAENADENTKGGTGARTTHKSFSRMANSLVTISRGAASNISSIRDKAIHHICTDPPYYDNVNYAECSNFFYVWMKRSLGGVFRDWFAEELTDQDSEAVANPARFREFGRKAKDLALADHERKMAASFREMYRVLRDDGVLTVMFTHKQVEAWDTLATSLIGAGFAIKASWPVHTESEHSLHQAKKNAAQSTILLTCRKRQDRSEPVWWDDIKGRVREEARAKAAEFEKVGIRGVDLYIATFGPTLAILSEHWPVLSSEVDAKTGDSKPLRPEVALDLAREEVVKLRKQGLLLGRTVQFDPATDWYLMAWDAFKAEAFPGDEARKLAIALGLDLERDIVATKRLVAKKGDMVDIQEPTARRKRDMVDGDKETFDCWVDAVHTAMMLQEEDGSAACKTFLNKTGLIKDSTFKACVQAMINAIPRTKSKGKFVRPEAETLEAMRLAFFDDLVVPAEEEPPKVAVQATFGGEDFEEADGDDEGEEDSES